MRPFELDRAFIPAVLSLLVLLTSPLSSQSFDLDQRRATHWAWQPLAVSAPPAGLAEYPIDAFIVRRLRESGLEASPPARPHLLLRRLWLDLVGVPPSAEHAARFTADPSDAAWSDEVDALLDSPQFGERWGRHWLDLVRYAETLGHEYDFPIANAWRYRDYVIRALNADVPYDQFLREHIAGDLLSEPRRDADGNNESVQATAAWWFVEQTHSPVDAMKHQADRIDNQIDVLGKAMLGMTVACARCHDHKFDAISQADYYSLFGFVRSSRYVQAPLRALDTESDGYLAARTAQHELALTWATAAEATETAAATEAAEATETAEATEAAEETETAEETEETEAAEATELDWSALRRSSPEQWSASAGTESLRPGDRVIATADDPTAWIVTNDGFGASPWRGPWCPDPTSETPELRLLPGTFWLSAIAGIEREGTVQTANFAIEQRYLHARVAGQHSRLIVVVDGFHIIRNPIYGGLHKKIDKPQAHWVTFDLEQWKGHTAFVQGIDQNAPDLGDPVHNKEEGWPVGWLAVQAVISTDEPEPPAADNDVTLPQQPWGELPPSVSAALEQLANAQAALPVSPTLPALCDGTGGDEPLYIRGSHKTPGPIQPRRFLTALAGDEAMQIPGGSGRLELAAAILAPDNPLPARALVNRLWHHLFGRGLAGSVDNLGVLGEPPSHPELLDWLARDFVAHGWSIKQAIRGIVLSRAYRQSSRETDSGRETDPANRLLHRQNVRRLEAEAVRDSLLQISGRIDPQLYGPSVPIPHADLVHARGKPSRSGPLDGDGRRSIYLAIRRNFLPPMLLSFDLPTPFAPIGRRNVSNVPAQALTLLNDPFVHAMARHWADRLLQATERDTDSLIDAAYRDAFARAPTAEEIEACSAFLHQAAADHGTETTDVRPWTDLLHCLVNTKEFTFRR